MTDQQHIKNLEAIAMSLASELALLRQQREPKACEHRWMPWSIVEPETERCQVCNRVVYKYSREPIDNAEPPKPACEHPSMTTIYSNGNVERPLHRYCNFCEDSFPIEPPKPERVAAREWWVHMNAAGGNFVMHSKDCGTARCSKLCDVYKVREILSGDEK